jgi:uncharacterized membrane protein
MFQDDLQQGDNQQVQNIAIEAPEAQVPSQEPAQQATPPEVPAVEQPAAPAPTTQPLIPATPPVKTNQEERMWGAISYIAFLGIVTLAMNPKSAFCKKHAAQGLLLFIVWFIGLIMMAVPSNLIILIGIIIFFGAMGLGGFGMYKAFTSYELNIPVLSDLAKKVPVDSIIGTVTGKVVEAPQAPQAPVAPTQPEQPVVQPTIAATPPVEENPAPAAPAQPEQEDLNQQ